MSGVVCIVNYLPDSWTEEKLNEEFLQFNPVACKLVTEKTTGRTLGYGFITFESDAESRNAINSMNGRDVEGKRLKVTLAKPRDEVRYNTNVYISGLPLHCTEEYIREMCSSFGTILELKLLRDIANRDNHTTLSGFVRFSRRSESDTCIIGIHGITIAGPPGPDNGPKNNKRGWVVSARYATDARTRAKEQEGSWLSRSERERELQNYTAATGGDLSNFPTPSFSPVSGFVGYPEGYSAPKPASKTSFRSNVPNSTPIATAHPFQQPGHIAPFPVFMNTNSVISTGNSGSVAPLNPSGSSNAPPQQANRVSNVNGNKANAQGSSSSSPIISSSSSSPSVHVGVNGSIMVDPQSGSYGIPAMIADFEQMTLMGSSQFAPGGVSQVSGANMHSISNPNLQMSQNGLHTSGSFHSTSSHSVAQQRSGVSRSYNNTSSHLSNNSTQTGVLTHQSAHLPQSSSSSALLNNQLGIRVNPPQGNIQRSQSSTSTLATSSTPSPGIPASTLNGVPSVSAQTGSGSLPSGHSFLPNGIVPFNPHMVMPMNVSIQIPPGSNQHIPNQFAYNFNTFGNLSGNPSMMGHNGFPLDVQSGFNLLPTGPNSTSSSMNSNRAHLGGTTTSIPNAGRLASDSSSTDANPTLLSSSSSSSSSNSTPLPLPHPSAIDGSAPFNPFTPHGMNMSALANLHGLHPFDSGKGEDSFAWFQGSETDVWKNLNLDNSTSEDVTR